MLQTVRSGGTCSEAKTNKKKTFSFLKIDSFTTRNIGVSKCHGRGLNVKSSGVLYCPTKAVYTGTSKTIDFAGGLFGLCYTGYDDNTISYYLNATSKQLIEKIELLTFLFLKN